MSAGHAHARVNEKHPRELQELLANPSMRAMMARRYCVVEDRDIPDLGGYSVLGDVYYLDRDFAAALRAGEIRIPRMTGEQIRTAVLIHEHVEKCLLDADNNIDTYLDAHEFATCAEHEYVRSLKVTPLTYERGLRPIIDLVQHKQINAAACGPARPRERVRRRCKGVSSNDNTQWIGARMLARSRCLDVLPRNAASSIKQGGGVDQESQPSARALIPSQSHRGLIEDGPWKARCAKDSAPRNAHHRSGFVGISDVKFHTPDPLRRKLQIVAEIAARADARCAEVRRRGRIDCCRGDGGIGQRCGCPSCVRPFSSDLSADVEPGPARRWRRWRLPIDREISGSSGGCNSQQCSGSEQQISHNAPHGFCARESAANTPKTRCGAQPSDCS
jgi:hypothetical protein